MNDLIRKIAGRQSTESALIPPPDHDRIDCPLHDAHQFVQERIATIDVVEALRYFNVPNDIVKVLRSYYRFLKTEINDSNDTKESRYEKSRDAFLKEFEAMVSKRESTEGSDIFLKLYRSFLYIHGLIFTLYRIQPREIVCHKSVICLKQQLNQYLYLVKFLTKI